MNKQVLLPALALSAAGALMSAHAAEPAKPAGGAPSAMTIARDPFTGQLRAPTAEEARTLAAPVQDERTAAGVKRGAASITAQPLVRQHPGGAASVRLSDEMAAQVVAVRGSDGKVITECHDNRSTARSAMEFAKRPNMSAATE